MLSVDGGRSYKVTKKIQAGTSGNFNGYGDLGSWVPPKAASEATPGEFQAIVGCNDCTDPGGALAEPAFLQTWVDDGSTLKLTGEPLRTLELRAGLSFSCHAKLVHGKLARVHAVPRGAGTPTQM